MKSNYRVSDFPLIVLAGGASSRMGMAKGLLPVKGQPFLLWQLRRFREAGGSRAIVVTGASADDYRQTMPFLREAETDEYCQASVCAGLKIRCVVNVAWELGSFSSLHRAIEIYCRAEYTQTLGAFVCPVDTPFGEPAVWKTLAAVFNLETYVVKPTFKRKGGHPILLSDLFLQKLREVELQGDEARLDKQIRSLPDRKVLRVATESDWVTLNLNQAAEWQAWKNQLL